jgi:acyl dehydratase
MSRSEFPTPIGQRYFEDYHKGAVFEYGPISVSEVEIIDFAKRFDPQVMHVDPQAASRGPFKGLIASGWHTIGLMMRLFADNYISAVASLASPGVDEVRWYKPVRPDDALRLRVSILETKTSRSKPDRGMVHSLLEGIDQNGDTVASLKAMNLIGLRMASPTSRSEA